jgi:hypothetical protein
MATTSTTTTDIPLPSLGPNADRGEDISQPTHGYPKIARLMGENPDLAIFRSFRELNARNLLYYQAELVHLEDQLSGMIQGRPIQWHHALPEIGSG